MVHPFVKHKKIYKQINRLIQGRRDQGAASKPDAIKIISHSPQNKTKIGYFPASPSLFLWYCYRTCEKKAAKVHSLCRLGTIGPDELKKEHSSSRKERITHLTRTLAGWNLREIQIKYELLKEKKFLGKASK